MSAPPLVSVVITTHNRLEFLKESIVSVHTQTWDDWELIVVDDASSDGTEQWLSERSWAKTRIHRHPVNTGHVGSMNTGLALAGGEFILWQDDDDRLRPDALHALATRLMRHPETVGAIGARLRFGEDFAYRIPHPRRSISRELWKEALAEWHAGPGQTLFRKALVAELGGFRPVAPVHDRDLFVRAALRGPFILEPTIVSEYRIHAGNVSRSTPGLPRLRAAILDPITQSLPPERRKAGARMRRVAPIWESARHAFERNDYPAAIRGNLRTVRAAPELIVSPVVRPLILGQTLRAIDRMLAKGWITKTYRGLKSFVRSILRGIQR